MISLWQVMPLVWVLTCEFLPWFELCSILTHCRSCKRIIFDTLVKRTPTGLQRLTVPEIKQIGGRAGRYRPANAKEGSDDGANVGYITCIEEVDLPYIQQALKLEPPPLSAAGILPADTVFQKLAAYFPTGIPFEYLIKRVLELSQVSPLFFQRSTGERRNHRHSERTTDRGPAEIHGFSNGPQRWQLARCHGCLCGLRV